MMNVSDFELAFGDVPHTPAACREFDGNGKKRGRLPGAESRTCPTCNGIPPEAGSVLICAGCHSSAPDLAQTLAAHAWVPSSFDWTNGRAVQEHWSGVKALRKSAAKEAKERRKAKARAKARSLRLTAKDREALLRDVRNGDQPAEAVEQFLAGLAG
jgi:hypothetical protein